MKKTMLFFAVALLVGAASAFSTKSVTGWYKLGGTDFSGSTDQASCATTNTNNCSITDQNGTTTTVYDAEANIGLSAHILKYN